ncbi:MAG: N-acetylmuramoyl-L-alanine amidase [Bacteroidales bacterium]|nr:N-acetylmuramoyl-L-alanine amidase [Bacteroidales bacterium]
MRKTIVFILALIPIATLGQSHSLKVNKWGKDTVYTKTQHIVGCTTPGSAVSFNGESVKVYKTGSFGKKITLTEGTNRVIVTSTSGAQTISDTLDMFYTTERPARGGQQDLPLSIFTSLYVETTEGAYFNYGKGGDRLGGAKVCHVDAGIPLEVVEEYGNLYKVKVAENKYFHIPKEYTTPTESAPVRDVTTNNWSVKNMGEYDRVAISLNTRHPYILRQSLEDKSIIIDIFGAQCNSNWLTQALPLGMVEYVDFEQVEYDVFRAKIFLKGYSWGTKVYYQGSTLMIDVKHAPAYTLKGMVIGIDAGHGGPKSTGAVSISGLKEKELNLDMAYTLKAELEKKGAKVVLSRTDDSGLTMTERKEIFLENNVDLVISIHCNAGGSPLDVKGTSTYYKHIHNRPLAEAILLRTLELEGVVNFGLVGNFNFSLNAPIEYPNVLVETQFLSNPEDEERIADPAFRKAYMKKVVKGVEDYLKSLK